jgi:uncharacterized protein YndB with AHSA1/START domain
MPEWDLVDEAVIAAPPDRVFRALVDYCAGKADWWKPHLRARMRGDVPPDEVGGVIDVRVGRLGLTRFANRTLEVVPGSLLRLAYIEGAFAGEGTWRFEPDAGGTRLSLRWNTRPGTRLMRVASRLMDVSKVHRKVMVAGFAAIRRHLGVEA